MKILRTAAPPGERLAVLAERLYMMGIAEEPIGSNDGPWVRFFMRGDRGLAWCAGFVLTLMLLIHAPMPSAGYWRGRSVSALMRASKRDGTFMGPAVIPQRGDLVFWKGRAGSDAGRGMHVDIVLKVVIVGDTVRLHVIGGNVSHVVKQRVIRHRDPRIAGYHRVAVRIS